MPGSFEERLPIKEFALWDKARAAKGALMFSFELTARCNYNCRHCYINLPPADAAAKAGELTFAQITDIVDRAADAGVLYCILTGGEPLLCEDFSRIYRYLRRKGIVVSLFTNASLITPAIARMLRRNHPRIIEVTVYGVTQDTYERVTRVPGSFAAFQRGLGILERLKIPVRLKAMIMRANLAEFDGIMEFCQDKTADYARFDPFLHLRYDGNAVRNQEIRAERLTPDEIVALEQRSPERINVLRCLRDKIIMPEHGAPEDNRIFFCGISPELFSVSFDGHLQTCLSLCHPSCRESIVGRDVRALINALVQRVRAMRTENSELRQRCLSCRYINLCMWCPARAFLETGAPDRFVQYFCDIAQARARAFYPEANLPAPVVARS
ncbi:MAG: radical SAM protein [Candidatus Omnitrophota bacterium]|nr:radical SAM protein [Candidatus Omnitrophota bacterium]